MILAGDIGATKTNLGYFAPGAAGLVLRRYKSYPSQEYGSLGEIIGQFVAEFPETVERAAFGIAGPVIDGRVETTNISWVVDARELAAQLGLQDVGLMNDLAATAYGVLWMTGDDRVVLNEGSPARGGTIAVIAAGTGLGEGGLVWTGKRYRALSSEGGHADFAPRSELEIDLLRFLMERFGRVSVERLVSGPGLYNIYQFFRSRSSVPEPEWLRNDLAAGDPSAVVSEAGLNRRDDVCVETLETFVSLYGSEAGNLALKYLSTGGLYIGGGIAPKILAAIRGGSFMASFRNKPPYTKVLGGIPVFVVMNDKAALYGAAHYAGLMDD
jgi:glucokinase